MIDWLQENYPTGRKCCSSPLHEGPRWLHIMEFHVKKYHYSGQPQVLEAQCRTCIRVRNRHRLGIKRHGKPMRAMQDKWVKGTGPLTEKEKQQRYWEKLKKDPKRLRAIKDRKNEYQRFRRSALKAKELDSNSDLSDI